MMEIAESNSWAFYATIVHCFFRRLKSGEYPSRRRVRSESTVQLDQHTNIVHKQHRALLSQFKNVSVPTIEKLIRSRTQL